MLFAIRDDDTSYFTQPNQLVEAYDFIERGCVSLSIVPYTVPYHKDSHPYGEGFAYREYDICENVELVDFLRKAIHEGRFAAMLHGYSHEYKKVDGIWEAEMRWKSHEMLVDQLAKGKKHLEETLDSEIRVFVAPGNQIDEKGVDALERNGLNYSDIISKNRDRKLDWWYLRNYIHRSVYKMRYDIPYGGVYTYCGHKELYAYPLKGKDYLMRVYRLCKQQNLPFALYTHYWELLNKPEKKALLRDIYQMALEDGAELVSMNRCFAK